METIAAVREQVRLLQEELRKRALETTGLVLAVGTADGACPQCCGTTRVQKTKRRHVATCRHGSFVACETVRVCTSGCRHPSGQLVTLGSEALAQQVASGAVYGYDLEVYVGMKRFLHYRQREEIRADVHEKHGILLSTGEISNLARRFLDHLEELHTRHAPEIRAALAQDGGYPLHIDATGEDGQGTLLVAYAGWRRWVLGSWKLTTERADQVLPSLQEIVANFGAPCAIMRDLGRAMTQAALDLVATMSQELPILACHLHFLKDIGKDLLDPAHKQMRELCRHHAVKAGLRAMARDLGRQLGQRLPELRDDVLEYVGTASNHKLPGGMAGIATVRAVTQWALDYQRDGSGRGFPFDRPYLDFYKRCLTVRRAVRAFMREPHEDVAVRRALERLARVLDPVLTDKAFALAKETLAFRGALFDELRDVLRLPVTSTETEKADPSCSGMRKELKNVQQSLKTLEVSLRERRQVRGQTQASREAIDVILEHLDRHETTLWGHEVHLTQRAGGDTRFVERTNNLLEGFFHVMKRGERRRSGRKILTHDFECLPPAAAIAINLGKQDYVRLICGSLDKLPAAFAALDSTRKARKLATSPTDNVSPPPSRSGVATASLPLPDRPVVRAVPMRAFIESAAHSRVPRTAKSAPG